MLVLRLPFEVSCTFLLSGVLQLHWFECIVLVCLDLYLQLNWKGCVLSGFPLRPGFSRLSPCIAGYYFLSTLFPMYNVFALSVCFSVFYYRFSTSLVLTTATIKDSRPVHERWLRVYNVTNSRGSSKFLFLRLRDREPLFLLTLSAWAFSISCMNCLPKFMQT